MEFPDVGEHCTEKTCKQLDFLPMKCDACASIFCRDHILYDKHSCPSSHLKDVQVPVCPLCNQPVPVKRGQQPDIGVSDHIDNECQSDKAIKKRKVYANRCSLKGCKQKEVLCDSCHKNYCLRHRHTADHDCKGYQGSGRGVSRAGAAAVNRSSGSSSSQPSRSRSSKPQTSTLTSIGVDLDRERRERMAARQNQPTGRQQAANPSALQAGMSEDEAMARAIQLSLAAEQQQSNQTTQSSSSADREAARLQEEEDAALARALAESEQDARNQPQSRNQQQSSSKSSCEIS